MDRMIQLVTEAQVFAAAGALLLSIGQLKAQTQGMTTDIPGALPKVHLVSPVADGQWMMPAGDYGNTRYSPLNKINTNNVANLHVVGMMSTGIPHGHEGGPLVVGSTLYMVTPFPNNLIALDLTKPGFPQKWIFQPHPDITSVGIACCDVVNRGASYADGKIIYNTLDAHTIAVDANTGKLAWKTQVGDIHYGETVTMAAVVVNKEEHPMLNHDHWTRTQWKYTVALLLSIATSLPCIAQSKPDCPELPDAARLKSVVQRVVKQGSAKNGGMGNQEWAAIVNRDGVVCAIVFSGTTRGDQWPGSRVIAAEKASTANGLSGRDYALSTANIYASSQPGQSLYSLATSAPPNSNAVFGSPASFGTPDDLMVGRAIGGIIVFAGGLPLYAPNGKIVGGLGLSGDTSCTDHVIAWKVRHELHLDAVPMGPSPEQNDNMILDWQNGASQSGFGHPSCKGGTASDGIIRDLSKDFPTGPRQR